MLVSLLMMRYKLYLIYKTVLVFRHEDSIIFFEGDLWKREESTEDLILKVNF